jgi:hypothetical protein
MYMLIHGIRKIKYITYVLNILSISNQMFIFTRMPFIRSFLKTIIQWLTKVATNYCVQPTPQLFLLLLSLIWVPLFLLLLSISMFFDLVATNIVVVMWFLQVNVDPTYSKMNNWKTLKYSFLHVPSCGTSDPSLKEQSWFPFQLQVD